MLAQCGGEVRLYSIHLAGMWDASPPTRQNGEGLLPVRGCESGRFPGGGGGTSGPLIAVM